MKIDWRASIAMTIVFFMGIALGGGHPAEKQEPYIAGFRDGMQWSLDLMQHQAEPWEWVGRINDKLRERYGLPPVAEPVKLPPKWMQPNEEARGAR